MKGVFPVTWFKNLKTTMKIMTLVGIMVVLLVVVAGIGYKTARETVGGMNDLYDLYATPAIDLLGAQERVREIRGMVFQSMLSTDRAFMSSFPTRIAEFRKQVNDNLERYSRTNLTDAERTLLEKLQSAAAKVRPMHDRVLQMGMDNQNAEAYAYFSSPEVANAEKEYFDAYEDLTTLLVKMAGDTKKTSVEDADVAVRMIGIVSVVAIVVGILIGIVISRLITKPLEKLRLGVEQFSRGDLTIELAAVGRDEIALMGHTLQDMSNTLNRVVGSVNAASRNISETSHEFSAMAQETNASVEEFRANVDEMGSNLNSLAAAGEEVNASVEEVAAGAQATAERGTDIARKVDEAMSAGEGGMSAVRRAVQGIDGVATGATEAAKSVQELGNRARQIQGFVAQIGGIADQTNLLALNAAIEAARAGDAGRGFAVVAEEVRKLAEDSNVAAKNIAELASTITGELDQVVRVSLDNAKASSEAKELSRETEATIENMIRYLRDIAGSTQDLAAVAEEQAASSEEIAETIQNMAARVNRTAEAGENIRGSVTEVAAAAERVALGAEGLATLAGELQDQLAFFKLANGGSYNPSRADRLRALPG